MADGRAGATTAVFVVPDDGGRRRADRFVADLSGLSRSYVQQLIAEGRLPPDGRAVKANASSSPATGSCSTSRRSCRSRSSPRRSPSTSSTRTTTCSSSTSRPGSSSTRRPGHSAGTLVNALLGGRRHGVRRDRRRRAGRASSIASTATRAACSWSPRHDAAQASLMAQLKARRVKKTYLALVQGSVAASRPDRGADRARPEAPDADGGRPRRPAVDHRLPGPRAVRRAGRCSSSTWSPAGPTRSASTSTPSATRSPGDPVYGTGTSRRGPDGLERLFLHAWRLELASPSDGHLIRATAPLPDELEAVLARLRAGDRPPAVPVAAGTGAVTDDRGLGDGGVEPRPRRRAGGAARDHLGPVGRGQGHHHRRAPATRRRARLPLRRDLHHAPAPAGRGRRRQLPLPRRRAVRRPARRRRAARGERGPRQLVRDPPRPGPATRSSPATT